MNMYKDLELVNNSDENLSKYLRDKFEKLIDSRALGSYPASVKENAREILMLYVHAKIDEEEGLNFSEFSKTKFEELLKKWDTLIPELKALILEDCFTNPNGNSEQFLFMRDRKIGDSHGQASYSHCNSSKYREHLILSDEVETAKEYLAIKRLAEFGFNNEDLENLLERDARINRNKYGLNKDLPNGERERRKEKLNIEGIFRIATNLEALQYFSEQEIMNDFDMCYFDKDTITENIRESASDKPNVKSLLSTDIKQILARANFIRWQDEQTKEGGLFQDERTLFSSRGFVEALTLSTNNFLYDFDRELYMAQKTYAYMGKEKRILTFRQIYEVAIQDIKTKEDRDKFKKDFNILFLGYNFGDLTDVQEDRLHDLYKEAVNYHQALLNELKRARRVDEQIENDVLVKSVRESEHEGKGGPARNHRNPTHDVDKVDSFIENVAQSGIRLIKIINVGRIGTPDVGQDGLIYYVFEKSNNSDERVLVWEPIGQPNNSTLIFKTTKDIDELAKEIRDKDTSIDELVAQKEAYRMWHREGSTYNANRLKLIFEVLDENNEDKPITSIMRDVLIKNLEREHVSLEYFRRRAIKEIPKEELGQAKDYIQSTIELRKPHLEETFDMSTQTLLNLKKGIKALKKSKKEDKNEVSM